MNEIIFNLMAFLNGWHLPGAILICGLFVSASLILLLNIAGKLSTEVFGILVPVFLFGTLACSILWVNEIEQSSGNYQVGSCYQESRQWDHSKMEKLHQELIIKINALSSVIEQDVELSPEAVNQAKVELQAYEKTLTQVNTQLKIPALVNYVILNNESTVIAYSQDLAKVETEFLLKSKYKVPCNPALELVVKNYQRTGSISN